MNRNWLGIAAVSGFIAVAAGAFAAHGLEKVVSADRVATFETGARYQMYHSLALLAVAWLGTLRGASGRRPSGSLAGWSFVAGIALFSGSLYALSLTGLRWLGMITPFGGVAFLLGWGALVWAAWRNAPVSS